MNVHLKPVSVQRQTFAKIGKGVGNAAVQKAIIEKLLRLES